MAKRYQYIVDLVGDSSKFKKEAGGLKGMLRPAMKAAAGLFAAGMVAKAGKEVYNYGKEIDKVRGSVEQLTGLQGDALNNVTGEVKAIADVYKKDYNEVLRTGNTLAKQFGTTNSQALDHIRQGFTSGADASGEMLEQVREYSTQFRAAGYDASEMLSIISQTTKAGIFSDKGADAIKEATIRLREMTTVTKEAIEGIGLSSEEIQKGLEDGTYEISDVIEMVSERLNELPGNSSRVGAAIADIFGGAGEDAGLEFLRTLDKADKSLDELSENSSEKARANEELVEAQKELNTIAANMFGGMNASVTEAKSAVVGFISDTLRFGADMVNWFIDLYNESVAFRYVVEYTAVTFENLWLASKTAFQYIWNAIETTANMLKDLVSFNFSDIADSLREGMEENARISQDFGKKTSEAMAEAQRNAMSKEKIEYVDLENAEEQGNEAGKEVMKGVEKATQKNPPSAPEKMDVGDYEAPELDDDLFSPGTGIGNKNRLSAMLAELGEEFSKTEEHAKLYGDRLTEYTDKQNILRNSIQQLIEEGYNVEGEAIQSLIKMQDDLFEKEGRQIEQMKSMRAFSQDLGDSLMDTAKRGADSFEEMANNLLNTTRSIISAHIAEGVAASVSRAMSSAPFPLNIIAAPTAAAMASTAFNTLIPEFAEGGIISGPTLGVMGEYSNAKSNPEVIAPLDKLKGMIRKDNVNVPEVVHLRAKRGELEGTLMFNQKREGKKR